MIIESSSSDLEIENQDIQLDFGIIKFATNEKLGIENAITINGQAK